MQKITPFLWLNGQAGEAINFHASMMTTGKIDIQKLQDAAAGLGTRQP